MSNLAVIRLGLFYTAKQTSVYCQVKTDIHTQFVLHSLISLHVLEITLVDR